VIKRLLNCFTWPIRALFNRVTSGSWKASGVTPSSTSSEQARSYRPRTTVREVTWTTAQEALQSIRTQVFIEEQQIDPADEWDPADQDAIHLLAERDGEPVGCARILDLTKIGRMAVLKEVRHKNVGSKLLRAAITKIQEAGNTPTLGAQITAMGFYANHGFLPEGPVFDDAGIPHRTMTLTGDSEKTLMPLDAESLRFDTPTLLVAIEPHTTDGEMRINILRLSDDEANWLTPRLCCYAATHGAHTLVLEIPEGEVRFPLEPPERFSCSSKA
jgi:predicted GNAT family N-acyltransferase